VFTFFTLVAAFDVLGLQLHLRGHDHIALVLWLGALTAWLVLGYFRVALVAWIATMGGLLLSLRARARAPHPEPV